MSFKISAPQKKEFDKINFGKMGGTNGRNM